MPVELVKYPVFLSDLNWNFNLEESAVAFPIPNSWNPVYQFFSWNVLTDWHGEVYEKILQLPMRRFQEWYPITRRVYICLYISTVSVILPSCTQKSLQLTFLDQHIWGTHGDKTVDTWVMHFGRAPNGVCCGWTPGARSSYGAKQVT
jgi:hypothetical protein